MTAVSDVDAHCDPGGDGLRPDPELAAQLPKLDPARLVLG